MTIIWEETYATKLRSYGFIPSTTGAKRTIWSPATGYPPSKVSTDMTIVENLPRNNVGSVPDLIAVTKGGGMIG